MISDHISIHEIHVTYGFLCCHILVRGSFKIWSRNAFFIVFDNIAASLHRNLKRWASVREHSYMPRYNV